MSRLDKKLFYERLEPFAKEKHIGIDIRMPLSKDNLRYTLIFEWRSEQITGEFNPMMYAQLLDEYQTGRDKYVTKDLWFNCIDENTTTNYKVYKYLAKWIDNAIDKYEEKLK